ncbi:hypothetical protein Pfo_017407 [Paulownia fortunei]|nr:hypothetical protein Pfo_017407 [Paulownia fortunei]
MEAGLSLQRLIIRACQNPLQQCNDFFFLGTEQISMGRVGEDFWFQDANGDPIGVYWLQAMWMGRFIQPDWDMFQSDHLCAKFAGSRAICGGPVYVSDSLGGHDFDLLNKLLFPDGTIPKCFHFAPPTRVCLFRNPVFDSKTILKIWNFNKPSSFNIFSFVPIKIQEAWSGGQIRTNWINSGGTVLGLLQGWKIFLYSSVSPKKSYLNGVEVGFEWSGNGKLGLYIPWYEEAGGISNVTFVF